MNTRTSERVFKLQISAHHPSPPMMSEVAQSIAIITEECNRLERLALAHDAAIIIEGSETVTHSFTDETNPF